MKVAMSLLFNGIVLLAVGVVAYQYGATEYQTLIKSIGLALSIIGGGSTLVGFVLLIKK